MSDEITNLDKQIQALLDKKKAILSEQRDEKLGEVKQIIQQFGFTASDLGLSAGGKKLSTKTKPEPKYANPSNPNETWHGGRGAKPKWVKAFLDSGGKLEAIEIKK